MGWKAYCVPTCTEVAGVPEMMGGKLAALAGVTAAKDVASSSSDANNMERRRSDHERPCIANTPHNTQTQAIRTSGKLVGRLRLAREASLVSCAIGEAQFVARTSRRSFVASNVRRQPRYPTRVAAYRGPEALRHRLSTVLPLFDITQCGDSVPVVPWHDPVSAPRRSRQGG